ncbi:MAG: gamma-glutamylcyclotransferase family protein [Ferruginibacter sp.]
MRLNKLFVYGTLRSSSIHTVMPAVALYMKKKNSGYVKARLFDTGEYPGAVNTGSTGKVYGEVIEIERSKLSFVLEALDEYEEIDSDDSRSLFRRERTDVHTTEGKTIKAWIYWYNKEVNGLKEIKSGNYK